MPLATSVLVQDGLWPGRSPDRSSAVVRDGARSSASLAPTLAPPHAPGLPTPDTPKYAAVVLGEWLWRGTRLGGRLRYGVPAGLFVAIVAVLAGVEAAPISSAAVAAA